MGVATPWLAEVVLISWRSVHNKKRPPLPSELLATFVVFGTFSLLDDSQPQIASVLGWGVVVATFLNLFDPAHPSLLAKPAGSSAAPLPQSNAAPVTGSTGPYPNFIPLQPNTAPFQRGTIGRPS